MTLLVNRSEVRVDSVIIDIMPNSFKSLMVNPNLPSSPQRLG